MNTLFSIDNSNHTLLYRTHPTLIRVIDMQSSFAQKDVQCRDEFALLALLFEHNKEIQMPPVGVIGPKEATDEQYQVAKQLGQRLAQLGLTIVCGGRNGVMEAVCLGVHLAGGQSIGILPGDHWTEANQYVTFPIVTNMGPTRNSLIAQTAFALIAVGGGYGTLTEMAFGLHYNKPVFALANAPEVDGVKYYDDIEPILHRVIDALLQR